MPYKKCLQCAADNGPRAQTCKGCGHKFVETVVEEPQQAKKTTTATIQTSPKKRTKRVQKVKEKVEVEDWTTLKKGDMIYVTGGPYWIKQGREHDVDDRVPMGENGKFRVSYLDLTAGIIYAYSKNECGLYLIYMGETTKSVKVGLVRRAHKIYLLNIKERVK